ncbi:protein of unknown function [Spirosomataceae bacterium TFI 002]|nr:protein of unknown function [Spirosomataceae bacterium TFI 002]
MLLSNYTFSVNLSHVLLFEHHLNTVIHPFLKSNKLVSEAKSFKLLTEVHHDGLTVSLQLFFPSTEEFTSFEQNDQARFFELLDEKFAGNYVYFQSLLEEF